jgi:hypothetical protein
MDGQGRLVAEKSSAEQFVSEHRAGGAVYGVPNHVAWILVQSPWTSLGARVHFGSEEQSYLQVRAINV